MTAFLKICPIFFLVVALVWVWMRMGRIDGELGFEIFVSPDLTG